MVFCEILVKIWRFSTLNCDVFNWEITPPLNQVHAVLPPTHFLFYFLELFIQIILKSVTQYLRIGTTFGMKKIKSSLFIWSARAKWGMKITKPGKLKKWKIAIATKNHNLWLSILLLLAQNKLPIHIINWKRGRDLADFSQFFALWRIWQSSVFA